MDKKIFVFLLFLITVFTVNAQNDTLSLKKNKITFGVNAGVNASFFNTPVSELGNEASLGYSSFFRLGANFGVRVFYHLNDYIKLESGFGYSGKGEEYRKRNPNVVIIGNGKSENAYYKTRFRLDYFEIPLIANVNLKKLFKEANFNYKPVYFKTGFSTAFNVNSDIRTNYYTPTSGSSGPIVDVEEDFNSIPFDYAKPFILNFIAGVEFVNNHTNEGDFVIGLLFNQTLQSVYNKDIVSNYNYNTTNTTFTFKIGFLFK
ncbi:MAG: outer membrane beta-barrel protein [Flavobacteriaceae bacterium]|nr:outer membrane beta-barrel protein [Flavobacteriaceae bacterium]